MQRRIRASLILLAFLATATGLAQAAHLHSAGSQHQTGHCAICTQIAGGTAPLVEGSTAPPAMIGEFRGLPPIAAEPPIAAAYLTYIQSRAPPVL